MSKKFIFTVVTAVSILLIGGIGFSLANVGNQLVFTVTVPKTTPSDDTIVLHYYDKKIPLTKIADRKYQVIINKQIFPPGDVLSYGYSRGGFVPFGEKGFQDGAEPRQIIIGSENEIHDVVSEWKWFSNKPLKEKDIPTQAEKKSFQLRPAFAKGVQLVDFWDESWPYQYEASVKHLKANGFDWIKLAPPWDIKNQDPPEISGTEVKVPVYPDDKLREHIRIFKNNSFKIMLSIQICCEPISFEGRSDDWWQQWYDQLENFVAHYADLSREEGVSALVIAQDHSLPLDPVSPPFASERWKKIIQRAKTSGALIGFETNAWGASYEDILPGPAERIDFWNELDFMAVGLWGDVVKKKNPVQKEVDKGMKIIMDKLDKTYKKIGKPIILTAVAYESREGAGLEKKEEDFYTWWDPKIVPVKYNSKQQAMIYEALMREVAEKTFIEGLFSFGYWYTDAPLSVDVSIRGKMAERILTRWFKKIHLP